MKRTKSAVALASLLIAIPALAAEEKQEAVSGSVVNDETRIYIGQCISNPRLQQLAKPPRALDGRASFIEPALIPVAKALIDALVDVVVAEAKNAGEDGALVVNSPFPVTKPFYSLRDDGKLRIHADIQCLQVVTGAFVPRPGKSGDAVTVAGLDLVKFRDQLAAKPRLFFEGQFVQVPGNDSAMSLAPRFLLYSGPVKDKWYELGKVKRNLSINITFQAIGAASGTAVGNWSIPFRNVPEGLILNADYFSSLQLPPIPLPALGDTEKPLLDAIRTELASIKAANQPDKPEVPDLKLGSEYQSKLAAHCEAWQGYVDLKRKRHADTKAPGDFVEPSSVNCPLNIRMQEILAESRKASMDRVVSLAEKVRERASTLESLKYFTCAQTQCKLKPDVETDYTPLVVSANVVEVKEASAFAKHLAKVAEAMKPTVTKALQDSTQAAKEQKAKDKEKEDAEAAEAAKANEEAYYVSKAEAEASYAAWSVAEEKERPAKWVDVIKKRGEANAAARKAKINPPYKFD